MCSLLYHIAVFQEKNPVRVANRGQSMRDNKAGTAFHQMIHRLLNLNLRPGIYRTGRLIQDQDLIIGQNGSRNRQKLFCP